MTPTRRAVLLAAFVTFAAIAGLGIFLGFDLVGSLLTALALGVLAGALIWGAARRAETFYEENAGPPRRPRFPGPPEHEDDDGPDDAPRR